MRILGTNCYIGAVQHQVTTGKNLCHLCEWQISEHWFVQHTFLSAIHLLSITNLAEFKVITLSISSVDMKFMMLSLGSRLDCTVVSLILTCLICMSYLVYILYRCISIVPCESVVYIREVEPLSPNPKGDAWCQHYFNKITQYEMEELSSVNTRHYLPGGAHDQESIICQVIPLIYALVTEWCL